MPGRIRFASLGRSVVGSTMRPGDPGTGRLVRDWGERLVAVRYRYSASPPTRFTTAEIVVDASPWKISPARRVLVELKSWESDLRKSVMEAGGKWEPDARAWRIRYGKAAALGLAQRVRLTGPTRAPKSSTVLQTRRSLDRPRIPETSAGIRRNGGPR